MSVLISINDDEVAERNEHFLVRIDAIGELANRVQLLQREAEIIILDDDGKRSTSFMITLLPFVSHWHFIAGELIRFNIISTKLIK